MKRELAAFDSGEPYKMPFLASRFFVHTLPKGPVSYSLSNLIRGKFPQQLILGFVKHTAYNNDVKQNGYIFENLNITKLVFKVNSQNSPPREYTPNFKSTPVKCLREYQHLLSAIGVKRLNTGVGINLKDFATNCCFWILDFNPEQCNNTHVHIGSNGVIGIEISFGSPLDDFYQMIGYGIYPTVALIKNDRTCTLIDAV